MKPSKPLLVLSTLSIILAIAVTAAGLFFSGDDGPFTFTSLRGEEVEIYGHGVYFYDSALKGPILRGADAVILFVGVPLLIYAILCYRRGSLRASFLLAGILACFLYDAASIAFGAAYNSLYLVYLAFFSTSLYAFILAVSSIDLNTLPERISSRLPHRGIAIFLFVAGLSPMVWLIDIIASLTEGHPPPLLASYTTDVTTLLDVGIITPAAILSGVLLIHRKPFGYLLSSTLLVLLTLIGLIVVGQTIMQIQDGIVLSTAEIAAFVVPFVSLALIAAGLVVVILRNIEDKPAVQSEMPV
jgi:hypothetical protein